MRTVAVGIDLGGTKLAAGRVAEGRIVQETTLTTPLAGADAIVEELVRAVTQVGGEGFPVGVAVAGQVDRATGTVLSAPNLPFAGFALGPELSRRLQVPVVIENDVAAAAMGEWMLLDPRPSVLAVLTVGTGIGGGVVVAGVPFRGAHGLAVEAGHVTAIPQGERCACGRRGCVEAYAGGRALLGRYRALAGTAAPDVETAEAVLELARRGDPVAVRVWDDAVTALGAAVRSMVLLFDPDAVAIGGGIVEGVPELRHAISGRVAESAWPGVTPPAVVELHRGAAVIGAASATLSR